MKKRKIILGIVLAILFLIILVVLVGGIYAWSKLSNVAFEEIDKDDLAVNENLYDDVKNKVENEISEEEFKDVVNFVLFGVDTKDIDGFDSGRSDTIIIASINPMKKSLKLISIPRDTYVNVPGYGKTKINHAYAYGKEQLSIKTINSNFGLNLTEYATIDFSGLINIIDEVGGINLTISDEEMNFINNSINVKKKLTHSGNVLLNGEQALVHSRNRTVGNDFTRASRQRDVIEALINKIATLDIDKILDLSDTFLKEVRTNINITKYIGLLTSVVSNKNEYLNNITSVQIPSTEYASGQMIDGIYYFVSDLEKAKSEMYKYIYEQ
jgi:PBP5 synthesis regulator protein